MLDSETTARVDGTWTHTLTVLRPGGGGLIVGLPPAGAVEVGRAASCEIRIEHPSVSRRHLCVRMGARPSALDLGARNGTFLHGRRLLANEEVPLSIGDVLELGNIRLRFSGAEPARAWEAPRRVTTSLAEVSATGLRDEVVALERARIVEAMHLAAGNQSLAARRLGMSRGALLARLRAWGLIKRRDGDR